MYFSKFFITPTKNNKSIDIIQEGWACCFIKVNSKEEALRRSIFYLRKEDWNVLDVEIPPTECLKNPNLESDVLTAFENAEKFGFETMYFMVSRDKRSYASPIKHQSSYENNLQKFLSQNKKENLRGRCLHYESGERCGKIIRAHSIQKCRAIEKISDSNHVIQISADYATLKKNNGALGVKKIGINKVSTFMGFCDKHDNELFEPIDNLALIPTDKQVFLYSYRSLCREYFVKENAVHNYSVYQHFCDHEYMRYHFAGFKESNNRGFKNLKKHKNEFDKYLSSKDYSKIRYMVFESDLEPIIYFSSLLYPISDFSGNILQNLEDVDSELEVMFFCSAPLNNGGWAFIISWLESSSGVASLFINSINKLIEEGKDIGDSLFRFIFKNCENHAISPKWWYSLNEEKKQSLCEAFNQTMNPFLDIDYNYLKNGLEGIGNWKFSNSKIKL